MPPSRHPFRSVGWDQASHTQLRPASRASRSAPLASSKAEDPIDCCCIQGAQCCASATPSLFRLVAHLKERGKSLVLMLPSEFEQDSKILDGAKLVCSQLIFYASADSLARLVQSFHPRCIILSSHDKRFASLRRHSSSIRWCHEVVRCYDPQASRCSTPLYMSGDSPQKLPGFAGVARSFYSFDYLEGMECAYTPGPIRILGIGAIGDPRSNFKALQTLSEKHPSVLFVWHGATRNKQWMNMHLCTPDFSLEELMSSCDYLLWCAEVDPCPLSVFIALYLGLRVMLFEKVVLYNLEPLISDEDGSSLVSVSKGSPQHALVHSLTKNPKRPQDISKCRDYVSRIVSQPPHLLVQHVEQLTLGDVVGSDD